MVKEADKTLLNDLGFQLIEGLIDHDNLLQIRQELDRFVHPQNKGGIRSAEKKLSSVKNFVKSDILLNQAKYFLNNEPNIVRVILFNKTPENNWLVRWHQDKTVAVSKKFVADRWNNWTVKDGIHHAHPPSDVLNKMITFRIHLDDTNADNGCLQVIPKSHLNGSLEQSIIDEYVNLHTSVLCEAKAGTTLVMRPLLLHSSSKAISAQFRRVLHIEFSSYKLPNGVRWA